MSKFQKRVLKDNKNESNRREKRTSYNQSPKTVKKELSMTVKKELMSVQYFEIRSKKRIFECLKNISRVGKIGKFNLLGAYFQRLLVYFRSHQKRYYQSVVRFTVLFY